MFYIVLESDLDLDLSETDTESNSSPLGSCGSDPNYSPSRASSPIPIPSESDSEMDVDSSSLSHLTTTDSWEGAWGTRSVTPTPDSESRQTTPVPHRILTSRLRTRRSKSSLTQSLTSPKAIHAIKSPILAASNALSLQFQVRQITNRRNQNTGNDVDSQSGTPSLSLRPRRLFSFDRRRLPSTPIPPPAPPPTMPLPALPPQVQVPLLSSNPLEESTQHNLLSAFKSSDTKPGEMPFGRRRGLSKSSLEEHQIDEIEEMKEN